VVPQYLAPTPPPRLGSLPCTQVVFLASFYNIHVRKGVGKGNPDAYPTQRGQVSPSVHGVVGPFVHRWVTPLNTEGSADSYIEALADSYAVELAHSYIEGLAQSETE
jgi:hypothetical protein